MSMNETKKTENRDHSVSLIAWVTGILIVVLLAGAVWLRTSEFRLSGNSSGAAGGTVEGPLVLEGRAAGSQNQFVSGTLSLPQGRSAELQLRSGLQYTCKGIPGLETPGSTVTVGPLSTDRLFSIKCRSGLFRSTSSTLQVRIAKSAITGKAPVIDTVKSATYWDPTTWVGRDVRYTEDLRASLPAMQDMGLNTVWLVTYWNVFEPKALPEPVFNDQAFDRLRQTLALLKSKNMRAIIGLNYLGEGPSFQPEGINYCQPGPTHDSWMANEAMYKAFVGYVDRLMVEIQDYSDMVYLMSFTEVAMPCNYTETQADQLALLFQQRIGNLPAQVSQPLRQRFQMGMHDFIFRWNEPHKLLPAIVPTPHPLPHDFYSVITYGLTPATVTQVDSWINRLREYYGSSTPIFIGEVGQTYCNASVDTQATVVSSIVSYAVRSSFGFNIWSWKNFGECDQPALADGLGMLTKENRALPVADRIKALLNP
jgi:hypothetical protein